MKFSIFTQGLGVRRLLLLASILFTTSIASSSASTFILEGSQSSNVTISVNVPSNSAENDLFFHISAPSEQSWLGWGFGTEMQDALMFVAYTSEDGDNVTVSPRIGGGHEQPISTDAVNVEVLSGTFVNNEAYNINVKCTDCRSWPLESGERGSIDVRSTAESMVYAIGSSEELILSNSKDIAIREHVAHGIFSVDLSGATGTGGVPDATDVEVGVTHDEDSGENHATTIIHGFFMAACFVVLFPVGALLIRLPFRLAFWFHMFWQLCTVLGVMIGSSLGIYVSLKDDKHPRLDSAHQGLGLAVVIFVLLQPVLGFLHHRTYKHNPSPTLVGKIHRYFGPFLVCLGIVNGALGLDFANNNGKLPAYFGFVIFIVIVVALASWVLRRKSRRTKAMNSTAAKNFRDGGPHTDVPLQNYAGGVSGVRHPYADANANSNSNPSQQSFAQADHAPPNYVNVMPKNEQSRMS